MTSEPLVTPARFNKLRQTYPLLSDLRRKSRQRMPRFAFDLLEGGCDGEIGISRNRRAFDDIEVIPRFGMGLRELDTSIELFGRRYAMPVGIAPTGLDGAMWPGATESLALTAQAANIPYLVGLLATACMEDVVRWAPDVTWLQLYPLPAQDYETTLRIVRRAACAGVNAIALTMDVPLRPKRPRDLRNGLRMPYSSNPRLALGAAAAPAWLLALARRGMPQFANMTPYAGATPVAEFVQKEISGGFDWEAVARIRDAWRKPLLVKGILHPHDAELARGLGLDGIVVSNHGARQFDAAPATIDVLPAIRAAVGDDMTVLLDSGVESGLDAVKALALGANAVLSGRSYLYGLGALGAPGAHFVAELFRDEVRLAMGQSGLRTLANARDLTVRHPRAWAF
jgi:(S)-mandelate dehydrogenase